MPESGVRGLRFFERAESGLHWRIWLIASLAWMTPLCVSLSTCRCAARRKKDLYLVRDNARANTTSLWNSAIARARRAAFNARRWRWPSSGN